MITADKASELARAKVAGLHFIDPDEIEYLHLSTRQDALANGVKASTTLNLV